MSPPRTPDDADERRFHTLYTTLYTAVHADVLRFVSRRLPREAAGSAEDVAAEALLVAWRRFDDAPRRPDALRAWVFGIARNCLLTSYRGSSRRSALAVRLADQVEATSTPHEGVIASLDLAAAWRCLAPGEQEVLALAVFEDLTSAQASLVLGTTATAYRLRLMRARRALRAHLDDADATVAARHEHPLTDETLKATR